MEIKKYFNDHKLEGIERGLITRSANQLRRGGIMDMDSLCYLLKNEPHRIVKMRNIGDKALAVIETLCNEYHRGKEDGNYKKDRKDDAYEEV